MSRDDTVEVKMDVSYGSTGKKGKMYALVSKEQVKNIPLEHLKQEAGKLMKETTINDPAQINSLEAIYEPVGNIFLYGDPTYYNTLVRVNLPYCLHLPNGFRFEMKLEVGQKALILFRKIWTDRAAGSSEVDFYTEDKPTYLGKSEVLSPVLPQKEEAGWELQFTGKNTERSHEDNGYFRYTTLHIELRSDFNKADLEDQDKWSKVREEMNTRVLDIINQFIDVYRYVTKEEFVQRLGFLTITEILFTTHRRGANFVSQAHGIGTAMTNRSRNEIQKIKQMMSTGTKPDLYGLILLNARAALGKRMYNVATIDSFQALDIRLENFLIKSLKDAGKTDQEIEEKIERAGTTKTRIRTFLKECIGLSLEDADSTLWSRWETAYNEIRIPVIHKGYEAKEKDAQESINVNSAVVSWIDSL